MQKVLIYVQAFNAEKYLDRALNSILNQTYTDFICWVCDNGSTDETFNIIQKYVIRDSRFVSFHVEKNDTGILYKEYIPKLLREADKSDIKWFCILDADDQYQIDFLSEMLNFVLQNNLECAACGSEFINADKIQSIGERCIEHDLIIQNHDFDVYFPIYHQYMRTFWGKLFCIDLLKKCNFCFEQNIKYGMDTLATMKTFYHAKRVGILSKTLHKYYISPKSLSYQFDKTRIEADQILALETEKYLQDKCGVVSQQNRDFLRYVYLNAIKDTFNVLTASRESVTKKLQLLIQILHNRYSYDLFSWDSGGEEKKTLSLMFISWIMRQKESYTTESDLAAEAMALIGAAPNNMPSQYTVAENFIFLVKLRDHWRSDLIPDTIDKQIVSLTEKNLLLKPYALSFFLYFHEICAYILDNKFENALHKIQEIIDNNQDIPQEYVLPLFSLSTDLSAKLYNMELFIYFKKIYISLLLDFSQLKTAKEELSDWDTILPDDLEFRILRNRINSYVNNVGLKEL